MQYGQKKLFISLRCSRSSLSNFPGKSGSLFAAVTIGMRPHKNRNVYSHIICIIIQQSRFRSGYQENGLKCPPKDISLCYRMDKLRMLCSTDVRVIFVPQRESTGKHENVSVMSERNASVRIGLIHLAGCTRIGWYSYDKS